MINTLQNFSFVASKKYFNILQERLEMAIFLDKFLFQSQTKSHNVFIIIVTRSFDKLHEGRSLQRLLLDQDGGVQGL